MFSARKARQHLRKSGVPPQELFLALQNIFSKPVFSTLL